MMTSYGTLANTLNLYSITLCVKKYFLSAVHNVSTYIDFLFNALFMHKIIGISYNELHPLEN